MKYLSIVTFVCGTAALMYSQNIQQDERPIIQPVLFHSTLGSPDIWEELALEDVQRREIFRLKQQFMNDKEQYRIQQGVGTAEASARVMEAYIPQLEEVLLPRQMRRLAQIGNQQRIVDDASTYGLTSEFAEDVLELTDRQKARIAELDEERTKEKEELVARFQDEYRELNQESREAFLSILDMSQRETFADLFGTPTEFLRRETTLRIKPN